MAKHKERREGERVTGREGMKEREREREREKEKKKKERVSFLGFRTQHFWLITIPSTTKY